MSIAVFINYYRRLEGILNSLPGFSFFTLLFIRIFSALQMEASVSFVSMGSNLSFLIWIYFFLFCTKSPTVGRFFVIFILGGVCCGPATEVTSEVRTPELFLSNFSSLSWLVAIRVFGSLESFSVTASMTVFISWNCDLMSFASWATI